MHDLRYWQAKNLDTGVIRASDDIVSVRAGCHCLYALRVTCQYAPDLPCVEHQKHRLVSIKPQNAPFAHMQWVACLQHTNAQMTAHMSTSILTRDDRLKISQYTHDMTWHMDPQVVLGVAVYYASSHKHP